jgi:hypothetical protein
VRESAIPVRESAIRVCAQPVAGRSCRPGPPAIPAVCPVFAPAGSDSYRPITAPESTVLRSAPYRQTLERFWRPVSHAAGLRTAPDGARLPACWPDIQLVILRTARYDEAAEEVEFGEISIFLAPTFIITVRQGVASELRGARQRLTPPTQPNHGV